MPADFSRREFLGVAALLGSGSLAGCLDQSLDAEETIVDSFDTDDIESVVVKTTNGNVDIRGSNQKQLTLEGTKRATDEDGLDDVTVETNHEGSELRIEVDVDNGGLFSGLFQRNARVDFDVDVPTEMAVTGLSTNGAITIQDGDGNIDADTTNGDIAVTKTGATKVAAKTTNGDIALAIGTETDVTVETTNGAVDIELPTTAEPELSFDTTNGDITVENLAAGDVDADGSVSTTIGDGRSSIEVETTNGDLAIRGTSSRGTD